ncbi:hypothetical protein TYRP_006404 [Tyrophagus putrescentiae]|nr:hypothetical protein TYRP_006404 [Tyrophagus putrescentiae]
MSTTTTSSCCSGANVVAAVGPSILNCNFVDIKAEVAVLVAAGVDFIHLDVMDGNFVDDITFGPAFVRGLVAAFPSVKFEVHMMVARPMVLVKAMAEAGAVRYIFHYEVTKEGRGGESGDNHNNNNSSSVTELVETIHSFKMEASIALNPATPVETVLPFLPQLDAVLVMTVVPGLGGQKFIGDMLQKVATIRGDFPRMDIELDGGVCLEVIEAANRAGANRVVVGTALLRSTTKAEDVTTMRRALFSANSAS